MEYSSTPTFLLMKGAMYVPRLILNKNVGTPRLKLGDCLALVLMFYLCLSVLFICRTILNLVSNFK